MAQAYLCTLAIQLEALDKQTSSMSALNSQLQISVASFNFDVSGTHSSAKANSSYLRQAADDALTRTRQTLRRLHNANLTTGPKHLPSSVLGRVFWYLDDDWQPGVVDLNTLVTAASVCHYWREVVTSYHSLWTNLRIHRVNQLGPGLQTIVSHSGSLLLNIEVSLQPEVCTRPPAVAALRQLHRIRVLKLEPLLIEEFPILSASEAPRLEELSLCKYVDYDDAEALPVVTLPILFNGVHPLLTRLCLAGVIRIGYNRFERLTKLVLRGQCYRDLGDLQSVLDFLQDSPQLADLSFIDCRTIGQHDDLATHQFPPTTRHMLLPHLGRITFIEVEDLIVGILLRVFVLPCDRMVSLLYSPYGDDLLESLEDEGLGAAARFQLLEPFWSTEAATKMEMCSTNRSWCVTLVSAQRQLQAVGIPATPEQVYTALSRFSVWGVTDLWICVDSDVPDGVCTWLMSRAQNVRRLYLDARGGWGNGKHGFDLLQHYMNAGYTLSARLKHCHITVATSTSTMESARHFLVSLPAHELRRRTFHIYPTGGRYQDRCRPPHVEDAWKAWKLGVAADEFDGQSVDIQAQDKFPAIPMTNVFKDDPVRDWDYIVTRNRPC